MDINGVIMFMLAETSHFHQLRSLRNANFATGYVNIMWQNHKDCEHHVLEPQGLWYHALLACLMAINFLYLVIQDDQKVYSFRIQ